MCNFDEAWRGKCKNENVINSDYCKKHIDLKCIVCGNKATHTCDHTFQFVCGAELCDNCEHGDLQSFNHITKKSINKSDLKSDIITEEILIQLGFERKYYNDKVVWITKNYMFVNFTYHIILKDNGYCAFIVFDNFLKQIKDIDDLKRLYFAITDEELILVK